MTTTLYAPELREVKERQLVVTSKGIVIGGAFVRKPPMPSADAIRLQIALLSRKPR